ncbi:hypothetical protein Lesp02_28670 [Lentzea sp. NBRC 105346]|uniref:hypothetical protein n=1 Tax=Lentzea sp. NBRC 105346 TaxID=3032205 RepID=UPI002553F07D|nr:hypothetical protein [Lentzea sp. NBRC 105346]GLZ30678.1 hypothetical protein Lesp02_28670 [Lentzea sp. NBRC 105346]
MPDRVPVPFSSLQQGSQPDLVCVWRGREVDLGFVRDDEITVFYPAGDRWWADENGMQPYDQYIYFAVVSRDEIEGPYRRGTR